MRLCNKRGETVLITGASSGIGAEMSKIFAENGFDLILVGRNAENLERLCNELQKSFEINVKYIQKDLSSEESAQQLYKEVIDSGLSIDVLINNAGVGRCGLFHQYGYSEDIEMITVNITTLTILTKLFVKDMIKAGKGKILNVASTGSYQPGPYTSVYYASKAYVLSFSKAMANELKDYGVSVTALCPGATKTQFSQRAGKADVFNAMSANRVARAGYNGLMKNKQVIIPGMQNKFAVLISKLLPGSITAKIVRRIQKTLVERY